MTKILAIGNSFSEDSIWYLSPMAHSAGIELTAINYYIGGCSIDTHARNLREGLAVYRREEYLPDGEVIMTEGMDLASAITERDWDYIIFQQSSGGSGRPETYGELGYLLERVRSLSPHATVLWNLTWAYQGDSTHPDFVYYDMSQQVMYERILTTYDEVVNPLVPDFIPVGEIVQGMREMLGDHLTRDGFHLSVLGRYSAALTWIEKLFGASESVTYIPDGMTEEESFLAKAVVKEYFRRIV